jgi:hypothetical protein
MPSSWGSLERAADRAGTLSPRKENDSRRGKQMADGGRQEAIDVDQTNHGGSGFRRRFSG